MSHTRRRAWTMVQPLRPPGTAETRSLSAGWRCAINDRSSRIRAHRPPSYRGLIPQAAAASATGPDDRRAADLRPVRRSAASAPYGRLATGKNARRSSPHLERSPMRDVTSAAAAMPAAANGSPRKLSDFLPAGENPYPQPCGNACGPCSSPTSRSSTATGSPWTGRRRPCRRRGGDLRAARGAPGPLQPRRDRNSAKRTQARHEHAHRTSRLGTWEVRSARRGQRSGGRTRAGGNFFCLSGCLAA